MCPGEKVVGKTLWYHLLCIGHWQGFVLFCDMVKTVQCAYHIAAVSLFSNCPVLYLPFLALSHSALSTKLLLNHPSKTVHMSQCLSQPLCCHYSSEPYIEHPPEHISLSETVQTSGSINTGANKTSFLIDLCLAFNSWTFCFPIKCETTP